MKNLLTGWRVVVVAIGFIAIIVGAIIALTAKQVPGFDTGDSSRHTGGVIVIIGVIICVGMTIYNYVSNGSEKNTELDKRYK